MITAGKWIALRNAPCVIKNIHKCKSILFFKFLLAPLSSSTFLDDDDTILGSAVQCYNQNENDIISLAQWKWIEGVVKNSYKVRWSSSRVIRIALVLTHHYIINTLKIIITTTTQDDTLSLSTLSKHYYYRRRQHQGDSVVVWVNRFDLIRFPSQLLRRTLSKSKQWSRQSE